MKKMISRELLLTTKAAQKWEKDFEENVEALMKIVSKIDTPMQRQHSVELLDFYNKKLSRIKSAKKKEKETEASKPFEFLISCN